MCNKLGIKFVRIKPRTSWEELYNKYAFPTRVARWCNNHYKLDCSKQLEDWIREQNCRPVAYIGLCADEEKRFKYSIGNIKEGQDIIYPIAEENIKEEIILDWASKQEIFDDWYKIFKRQGCMFCPMSTIKERAFIKLKYPDKYDYFMNKARESERKGFSVFSGDKKYDCDYQDMIINKKWIPKLLEEMEEKGVKL